VPVASSEVVRPSGVVAFVFTDVVDSTALWEADPAGMREAMELHNRLIDEVVATLGGVRAVEQGAGDSTVVAFGRASDAMLAAVEVRRAFAAAPWPTATGLRVRMAVHAGEVEAASNGTYAGPVMNRCGRLLAAAHGGQVVVSQAARDLVSDLPSDGLVLRALGSHHLRGIDDPMLVFQLDDRAHPVEFPPLRTLEGTPNNVPVQLTTFVGRADELSQVEELVASHRLVTLTGSGGVGKTRLAVEVAAEVIDRFDDGVWFVDLAPVTNRSGADDVIAAVLSVRAPDTGAPLEVVIDYLRGHRALIVLDNCEHLLAECAELAMTLVKRCPSVHVLVTSREPLGVRGEQTCRLRSLSTPPRPDPEVVLASEAGQLFVDRARLVKPTFAVDEGTGGPVMTICERLDGIPLALELAAARVRSLPVEAIAAGLEDRFRLLSGGGRDVLARQRTLEASVAWSYELLDDVEQAALRQLSVFVGGFTLDAARGVLEPVESRAAMLDMLTRLVDKSLITTEDGIEHEPRYGMLDTVRAYAQERLLGSDEAEATRTRHLGWFTQWCAQVGAELEGRHTVARLQQLSADYANIRAALSWADATDDASALAGILGALAHFWQLRGRLREAADWLSRSEARIDTLPPERQLPARWCRAWVYFWFTERFEDLGEIIARFERAAVDANDSAMQSRAAGLRSAAFVADTDLEASRRGLTAAAAQSAAVGDAFWEGWCEGQLVFTFGVVDRFDLAEPHLERMATIAHQIDSPHLIGEHLAHRGWAAAHYGDLTALERDATALLQIWAPYSDTAAAKGIISLATVNRAAGRLAEAKRSLEALLGHLQHIGLLFVVPIVLVDLGEIALAEGHMEPAQQAIADLWADPRLDNYPLKDLIALAVGVGAWKTGDHTRARALLQTALEIGQRPAPSRLAAVVTTYQGILDRDDGQHRDAADRFHQALDTFYQLGCRLDVAWLLEELAGLDVDAGRLETAARMFGASQAIRDPQRAVFRPIRQEAFQADRAAAESGLGPQFGPAFTTGYALDIDEAVELARRTLPDRHRPTFGWDSLTPTETQVLELAIEGRSNPDIAQRLTISRETVKTHLSHIYRKLDVNNRTQLAAAAVRHQ
jgi:predicted ATPase/class 3 adenylate cyclase/DNA-binding CsgD family transcriptional regulator